MMATSAPRLAAIAPEDLGRFVAANVISAADAAAVAGLVRIARGDGSTPEPALPAWIAMCLAVKAPTEGHTCVPLIELPERIDEVELDERQRREWPADAKQWEAVLRTAGPLVGGPGDRAPFINDANRLYLARSRHEEQEIERRLTALADRLDILLGGPGTGKTTEVARRLVALFQENPGRRIALAAPTGKAAARMKEALLGRLSDAKAPDAVKNASQQVREAITAAQPTTIHKLLGMRPSGTPRYRFNSANQLTYELVVIDETSMISSSLMYHLLDAIGEQTRLLLVGDPNQLASVDAGSVLGDLAKAAGRAGSTLDGRAHTLTERHRFGHRIGALADAILEGEHGVASVFEILERRWAGSPDSINEVADDPDSVAWVRPDTNAFKELMNLVVEHAEKIRKAAKAGDIKGVLELLREQQVLCAHREGKLGVSGRNAFVERQLDVTGGSRWYSGRPVLVTANNSALGLHNGDVGVVVPESGGLTRHAVFPVGRDVKRVPVSRLENVSTVHALTIHMSQGSEYGHAIVILPEKPSRILTQELLYTGITRASRKVTIVGSREVIEAAIRTPIRRATGLAARFGGG